MLARNVEETQEDTSAVSLQASPEAGNVMKTQEILQQLTKTTLRHLQKLARKQKMLKRLNTLAEYTQASPEAKNVENIHETHWRHL